ncbi:MAG: hypothetical protein HUU26_03210 [Gemmatimonadaceae bacterium]|nr:hypothetical protein [Gemmatimonadaceae bacterium]
MPHALMYHGGFEANFTRLTPGARSFLGSDNSERVIPEWPDEADGLRIGYMEKQGKRFVAVRVMDGADDVVLEHEVLLDPPSHMGYGKRFSPEPTIIEDDPAKQLLHDIIERNPGQRARLSAMRDRRNWAPKARG